MNLDFIKFNEQIVIRGNIYRNHKKSEIKDENEKLNVRLQNTTPFIDTKKMDHEFDTDHKKLVQKIRKNLRGVPVYLPMIKENNLRTMTRQSKMRKNQSDGNLKTVSKKQATDGQNKGEEEKEMEENKNNEENNKREGDQLFKTQIEV
ncbi:MAG: hypothetical protein MJ252_18005 [archaeon]|nr:hypothetical protein [archaeon]